MIVAARPGRFSLFVHAVDDSGALCGAKPTSDWRSISTFPINCPRCLYVMARPRFALCETPGASTLSVWHVRLVGPEGVCTTGTEGGGTRKTLCGAIVGWDLESMSHAEVRRGGRQRMCASCATQALNVIR